jgi:hypothetical protein
MTAPLPIEFHAGRNVRAHVAREGFRLADFPTLLGAAGGPKWLVLHGIDRVLAPRVRSAAAASGRPVDLIGSSIGAWRFAAWMQHHPEAALDRLLESYTAPDPFTGTPPDFDALFRRYVDDLLGESGEAEILDCAVARLHAVVAFFPESLWPADLRLGLAALRNALGRRLQLAGSPQRLLCSTAPLPEAVGARWPHHAVAADGGRLRSALHATAAVPGMIRPVPGFDPARGDGVAVDGGIVDYHFDGSQNGAGFVLYPHFYPHLTPGWFDKPFRGRRIAAADVDDLLLICPSPAWVATLPGRKIPDRTDPRRLGPSACHTVWCDVAASARQLGDALDEVLERDGVPEAIGA